MTVSKIHKLQDNFVKKTIKLTTEKRGREYGNREKRWGKRGRGKKGGGRKGRCK